MSILLNDNIKVSAGKSIDAKYLNSLSLPYTGVSQVNSTILLPQRHIGMTVNINNVEYWYANGLTNNDLVIKSGGGEVNTASNVGLGTGLFKIKNGFDLRFRSISGHSGIILISGDTVVLRAEVTGQIFNTFTGTTAPALYLSKSSFNTYSGGTRQNILNATITGGTNLGTTGNAIFSAKNGRNLEFKKLVAGTNITLASTSTGITINSSGGGSGEINTASNVGIGYKLFKQKNLLDLQFRTISGGSNIVLVSGDTLGINLSGIVTVSNLSFYTGSTAPNIYYSKTQINFYTGTTVPNTYHSKLAIVAYSGTTVPANYYNKTQINSYSASTLTNVNTRLLISAFNTYSGGTRQNILNTAITGVTNGLTKSGRSVRLGGSLTGSTNIFYGANDLIFSASTGTLKASNLLIGNPSNTITSNTRLDVRGVSATGTIARFATTGNTSVFEVKDALQVNVSSGSQLRIFNAANNSFGGLSYQADSTGANYAGNALAIATPTGAAGMYIGGNGVQGAAASSANWFLNNIVSNRTGTTTAFSLGYGGLGPAYTSFNPSTGNAVWKSFLINPTYNVTGTHIGSIFGIDYTPAVTSIGSGTTHYAIRTSTGSVLFANNSSATLTSNTRVDIRGIGTGSTTTILRLANSSNISKFSIADNGSFDYVGTWTATANSQYHGNFGGTFTPRAGNADNLNAYKFTPSMTANFNGQVLRAVYINPTMATGGQAVNLHALEVVGNSLTTTQTASSFHLGAIAPGSVVLTNSSGNVQLGNSAGWSSTSIFAGTTQAIRADGSGGYVNLLLNTGIHSSQFVPSARFDIRGNGITTGSTFRLADSANATRVTVLDNGTISIVGSGTDSAPGFSFGNTALANGSNSGFYYTLNQINFTTAGSSALALAGTASVWGVWGPSTDYTMQVKSAGAGNSNRTGTGLIIQGGISTGNGAARDITFQTSPSGVSGTSANAYVNRLSINGQNGGVLIGTGTLTTNTKLDVRGLGTTTGTTLRTADSSNSARFTVLDNGLTTINASTPTLGFNNGSSTTTISLVNTNTMYASTRWNVANSIYVNGLTPTTTASARIQLGGTIGGVGLKVDRDTVSFMDAYQALDTTGNPLEFFNPEPVNSVITTGGASNATTISASTTNFPSSGYAVVSSNGVPLEIFKYTGTTSTTFRGCTRGAFGTTAIATTTSYTVSKVNYMMAASSTQPLMFATRTSVNALVLKNVFSDTQFNLGNTLNFGGGYTNGGTITYTNFGTAVNNNARIIGDGNGNTLKQIFTGGVLVSGTGTDTQTANTRLDVRGIGASTQNTLRIANSGNTLIFRVQDNKNVVYAGTSANTFTFSGTTGFKGAQYLADYSANFTARSLVDAAFVTGTTSTGYLSKTAFNIYSGSTVPNTYYSKSQINFYTGTTAVNIYLSKIAFTAYSGGTRQNILNATVTGGTNLGTTGEIVFSAKNGRNLEFKRIVAGANITVTSSSTGVTISTGGSVGEVNTASNIGTGYKLFKQKSLVDLQFRTISGGTNILLVSGDTIGIQTTGLLTTSAFNIYSGTTVPANYYNKTQINSYSASTLTNINTRLLTSAFNTYSGGTRQNILNSAVTGGTNLGALTGQIVFSSKNGRNLEFKRIVGSVNISVGSTSTGVTINALGLATTANLSFYTGSTVPNTYYPKTQINFYSASTVPNTYYSKTQINFYTGSSVPNTYYSKAAIVAYTGTTIPANYYNKTQINFYTGTTEPNTYYSKSAIIAYTGTTVPANYYNKTQINSYSASTLTNVNTRLLISAFNTYSGGTRQNILNSAVTGATNLGTTGTLLFAQKTGRNLEFKRLVAGNNVTLTSSSTGVTIAASGTGGGYTVTTVSTTPHNEAGTSGEIILLVNATGGARTVNLPTAVGNTAKITIKKIDSSSNIVTVDGSTTETIDGDLTKDILFKDSSITLINNNSNWFII
jgi:hypothetical protein